MKKTAHVSSPIGEELLECERPRVFHVLMFLGGFYGGFTFTARGGIFCNAQTANFVMCASSMAYGDWKAAGYYFIPMLAYLVGVIISEVAANPARKEWGIRWDTLLIAVEIVCVLILGFIPDDAPYQISHIIVNVMTAMQWNTYRQAAKIPAPTIFVTNHLRLIGVQLSKALFLHRGEPGDYWKRTGFHASMILMFVAGVAAATFLCATFSGKGIWFTLIPLIYLFLDLLYADRIKEPDKLNQKPHGH